MPIRSRTVHVFGGVATIRVEGGSASLVDDAVARLTALARCWSSDDPDSALGRLNRSAGIPRVVDDDLFALVQALLDRWRATSGWFDPTVRTPGRATGSPPTVAEAARVLAPPAEGCGAVRIDPGRRMVWAPVGLHLHPRGLERSLAFDLVTAEALAAGASAVHIDLGRRSHPPALAAVG